MVTTVPAVVIAAPASGSGKTTVATGLIGALRRAGHTVAPFKVGPDFIDPGYHALAAGRPGRNLDPVLVGEHLIGPLYGHGTCGVDIAVVEGVMGLFDGRIAEYPAVPVHGSTAEVAGLLGAPVVLVIDGRGQGQSLAALLHGFATFGGTAGSGPPPRIAGVILNRVGSARHEMVLRQACAQAGVAVLGAIPRAVELDVPSRYLGLITTAEYGLRACQAVEAMTTLVAAHVDVAAVAACACARVSAPSWDPAAEIERVAPAGQGDAADRGATVAVAAGRAFSFGYTEHGELLRAAGAHVVEFDPLCDPLPEATEAVLLPGGFPEQFTAELAANHLVRGEIRELAAAGGPIHAECAGLIYLVSELDDTPMCGVLAGSARFTERLTLGYRESVALTDSSVYSAGRRIVGHEFHRTAVTFTADYPAAWASREHGSEGVVVGNVHASYLHTHPAAAPESVARFVACAARRGRSPGANTTLGR